MMWNGENVIVSVARYAGMEAAALAEILGCTSGSFLQSASTAGSCDN
jgi:hypothetical protein